MRKLVYHFYNPIEAENEVQATCLRLSRTWLVLLVSMLIFTVMPTGTLLAANKRIALPLVAQHSVVEQHKLLERLTLEHGDHWSNRMNEDGTLGFLSANKLSAGCVVDAFGVLFKPQSIVECFLQEYAPLFNGKNGSAVDTTYRVTEVSFAGDEMFISFSQYFGDVPVAGSKSILTVNKDSITQFSGSLYGKNLIPPLSDFKRLSVKGNSRKRLLDMAMLDVGLDLSEQARYFDPHTQTIVTEYGVAGILGEVVRVSERDFSVLEHKKAESHHAPMQVETRVRKYHKDFYDYDPAVSGNILSTRTNINNILSNPYTGECGAELDLNSANDHARPRIYLEDDDDAYREYYQGEYQWHPDYNGEVLRCDTEFMNNTTAGRRLDLMTAHYWLNDIADFTEHWRAALTDWYSWDSSDNLRVYLMDDVSDHCMPGEPDRACVKYANSFGEIMGGATANEMYLTTKSLDDLSVLAHEYGHVVHQNYGFNLINPFITNYEQSFSRSGLAEGFAQQFVLNYALYRHREAANRPHDPYATLTGYHDQSGNGGTGNVTVAPNWIHGERLHTYYPSSNNMYALYYDTSIAPCSRTREQDANAPYTCGLLLGRVYWELAWNQCKVGYRHCAEGETILTSPAYASLPERPANVAYTSALRSLGSNSLMSDFFSAVSRRYSEFRENGDISFQEYLRVMSVLNRYCVGWGNRCGFQYKSVGSPLPESFTKKASFANGDSQHYLRAQAMTRVGTTSLHATPRRPTPPGIWYYNLAKFVRLEATGSKVRYEMDLDAGNYSVDFSTLVHRNDTLGCIKVDFQEKKSRPAVSWGGMFGFSFNFGFGSRNRSVSWESVSSEIVCPVSATRTNVFEWGWQDGVAASSKVSAGTYRVTLTRMASTGSTNSIANGDIDIDVVVINRK